MKNEVAAQRFDYSTVDDDLRRMLISHAGDINRQKGIGLKAMLAMGETIGQAHELLANHGDGLFGKWVEAECGISRQSAFRYLNAHKAFGKDCNSLLQTSTAEAIYALSAPGVPPEAAKKAKKLADKGIKVTEKIAKELVKKDEEPEPEPVEEAAETVLEDKPRQWGEGDSLEDVQADLKELNRRCKELSKFARMVIGWEGDKPTRPFCVNYTLTTLSHSLLHVGRVVMNDLPVGGTAKKPILFHEEKAASLAK